MKTEVELFCEEYEGNILYCGFRDSDGGLILKQAFLPSEFEANYWLSGMKWGLSGGYQLVKGFKVVEA